MYERILVPLDGSALAELALRHAGEIARASHAEIVLLQAVYLPMPVVPEPLLLTEGKMLEAATQASSEYLEGIAARLRAEGLRVRTLVDERPAADAILHVADREEADLVVMSTHGRSGLSRLVMGSVAESVVRNTRQAVMLVKPEQPAESERAADEKHAHVS